MAPLDRPKLRPLSAQRFDHQGRLFDGQHSLGEIQSRVQHETGQWIPTEVLERMVVQLDEAMVLDGPTFASFLESYRRSS
jgi:hypothetical protein